MTDLDKRILRIFALLGATVVSVIAAFVAISVSFSLGIFCWGPLIFLFFMFMAGFFLISAIRMK